MQDSTSHFPPLYRMLHKGSFLQWKYLTSFILTPVFHGPLNNRNGVCVCACIRGGMFTFPLYLKHMDWVGICRGRRVGDGGKGMDEGSNLRGVSHSAGRHMVFTHYYGLRAEGEGRSQKGFSHQSQAWIDEYNSPWRGFNKLEFNHSKCATDVKRHPLKDIFPNVTSTEPVKPNFLCRD